MRIYSLLRPLLLGVAVAIGSISPAQASSTPLTLSDVFSALDSTSPELWNAKLRIADARAEVSANRAVPNPAFFGISEELSGTGGTVHETTVGIRQELSFLWSRQPSLKAAKSSLRAARISLQEQRLAAQSTALMDLVRLKQLTGELEFLDTLIVRYETVTNAAVAREREGDISGYDAARVKMEGAEIYNRQAALQTEYLLNLSALQKMTGLSESELGSIVLNSIADISFAKRTDAVAYAREHSPELRRIALEERSAASALSAAKWDRLPGFSVGIGRKANNLDEDGLYWEGELEIPLFHRRTREVQRARIYQQRAVDIRGNTERRLDAEVSRAFLLWQTLRGSSATVIRIDDVLSNLRTATSLYLSGETGYLELLDAFSSSITALQSIFALEGARWQADLALRNLTGYPILETE